MRARRVLATVCSLIAVGGVGALVAGMAAAQPGAGIDPKLSPLPAARGLPPVSLATAAVPSPAVASTPRAGAVRTSRRSTPTRLAAPKAAAPSRPVPRTPTRPPSRTLGAARARPARRALVAVRGQNLPLPYGTGSATRIVTVVAASTGSTTAALQAWDRAPGGGWLRHGSAVTAHVGSQGLTTSPSEQLSATPIGSFTLTQAFGRLGNPGTRLPYDEVGSNDWWVSDPASSLYNTHQRCSSCPFDTSVSENLYGAGSVYDYAVVIDYNRSPVHRGAGSAFFLHVSDGGPTAGCVSIPRDTLVAIMQWLLPGAGSRILIGVS